MNPTTMHCKCGNDTYHILFTVDGSAWAECTECMRPTSALGVGWKKLREWEASRKK